MIESMACGTPVIAYKNGSVPEIIDSGQSGLIVENKRQAVKALKNIDLLDRDRVRKQFEKRFSVTSMTENYVRLYQNLIPKGKELMLRNGNTSLMKIS